MKGVEAPHPTHWKSSPFREAISWRYPTQQGLGNSPQMWRKYGSTLGSGYSKSSEKTDPNSLASGALPHCCWAFALPLFCSCDDYVGWSRTTLSQMVFRCGFNSTSSQTLILNRIRNHTSWRLSMYWKTYLLPSLQQAPLGPSSHSWQLCDPRDLH